MKSMYVLLVFFVSLFTFKANAQFYALSEECKNKLLLLPQEVRGVQRYWREDSLLNAENFPEYLCRKQEINSTYLKHLHHRESYLNKAVNYLEGRNTLFLTILRPQEPKIKIKIERSRGRAGEGEDTIASLQINGKEFIHEISPLRFDKIAVEDYCEGYLTSSEAYFVDLSNEESFIYIYLYSPHAFHSDYSTDLETGELLLSGFDQWREHDCFYADGDSKKINDYGKITKLIFSYNNKTNMVEYVSSVHIGHQFILRFRFDYYPVQSYYQF